jgi:hypothetical protein
LNRLYIVGLRPVTIAARAGQLLPVGKERTEKPAEIAGRQQYPTSALLARNKMPGPSPGMTYVTDIKE